MIHSNKLMEMIKSKYSYEIDPYITSSPKDALNSSIMGLLSTLRIKFTSFILMEFSMKHPINRKYFSRPVCLSWMTFLGEIMLVYLCTDKQVQVKHIPWEH